MASPAGLAGSGGGSVDGDRVAGIDARRRIADRAAVDRHLAVEDQRLQARARQRRNARGQHAVEPLAGLLGGDRDGFAARSSWLEHWFNRCPTKSRSIREAERAIASVRRLMMIASVTTFLAVAPCSSSSAIAFRSWRKARRGQFADVTAALPAGAKVLSTAVGNDHIVVTIEVDGAIELRTFDPDTLKPLGRLRLAAEALKRPDLLQHRQQIVDRISPGPRSSGNARGPS